MEPPRFFEKYPPLSLSRSALRFFSLGATLRLATIFAVPRRVHLLTHWKPDRLLFLPHP